ncbi:hypothetical protein X801_09450 [Opisthorchis viverrini]|uniref:Uncharacterized protein n=1 Tax=Opisthorchis viverrini TaxID=6198 RepID=A0A1S8WKD6_OPIVI|nr:hypothetical protein X801_09450 [Opisthorchis viverrini]
MMLTGEWKEQIKQLLGDRDRLQKTQFEYVITDCKTVTFCVIDKLDSKLRDRVGQLTKEYNRVSLELKSSRQENLDLSLKLEKSNAFMSHDFEQKVFRLQEEVTELHRQKGDVGPCNISWFI